MSHTINHLRKLRLQRSELAVPGSNPDMITKAASSAADFIFLDIEDAVAPPDKERARKNIIEALATAGADIIAYDATQRPRPVATRALVEAIHARGRLAMADCSVIADAEQALAEGADIVGSTLAGYTGSVEPTEPDFALIGAMRRLTPYVVAEGNIRTPKQASQALVAGASMVVVGSAITRPEHVTGWFRAALDETVAKAGARWP